MTINPDIYIRANELNYFEGRIVELVTKYVDYEDGSVLLDEAARLLASLIDQTKKNEDIDAQIPLWQEHYVNERIDLNEQR